MLLSALGSGYRDNYVWLRDFETMKLLVSTTLRGCAARSRTLVRRLHNGGLS